MAKKYTEEFSTKSLTCMLLVIIHFINWKANMALQNLLFPNGLKIYLQLKFLRLKQFQ